MLFTADTLTWSMSKSELKAILAFAFPDKSRPNLNVVAFFPESGELVATDGNTALMVSHRAWRPSGGKPVLLPFDKLKGIAAAANVRDTIEIAFKQAVLESGAKGAWEVVARWGALRLEVEPNGLVIFPPVSQIWPTSVDTIGSRVIINATFIARVNAIALTAKGSLHPVQIYPAAHDFAPVLFVHAGEGCVWSAILMPLREIFTIPATA